MAIRYLLADNDMTLMDFHAAERKALQEALTLFGIPTTEETCRLYHEINQAQWKKLERGETTRARLRHDRWAELLQAMGMDDARADEMSRVYARQLGTHPDLLPGAMAFLRAVHPQMKIALVSNGFSAIQRGRLSLSPIADELDAVLISQEVGADKPDPAIVYAALKALGCTDPSEAVLLGDSASADIACAKNAGIRCIHLQPEGRFAEAADWGVTDLRQAAALLTGSDEAWQHAVLALCREYDAQLFAGESSGHDLQHTLRVERTAAAIAAAEGGDLFTVRLAALLHDADDGKLFDTAESMAHARGFMADIGLTEAEADRVCGVIRTVGFKGGHNAPPDSVEGRIVQDADRLDAIGAIGIGRAFAYGGAHGRAMHLPEEKPAEFLTAEAYASAQGTTINHFYEKLLLLKDRMTTSAGKAMAERRHAYMEAFLKEFYAEWNGEK